jgi:hypothetical protein
MGFSLTFKNLGHYFASGAKYISVGIGDIIKVANKSQIVAPEVELLVGALAGPQAVKLTDLAFHVLGSAAAALAPVGADAAAQQTATGVNLMLDLQTVNDIKAAIVTIEAVLKAAGATKPTA